MGGGVVRGLDECEYVRLFVRGRVFDLIEKEVGEDMEIDTDVGEL